MWKIEDREFTTWCELEQDGVLIWLEWNERVFAYRCGAVRGTTPAPSHLGYADSLAAAQAKALELFMVQDFSRVQ